MFISNSKSRGSTIVILAIIFITVTHRPASCKAIPEEDTSPEASSTPESTTQTEASETADTQAENKPTEGDETSEDEPTDNTSTERTESPDTEPSSSELSESEPPKNELPKRRPLKAKESESESEENESTDSTPSKRVRPGNGSPEHASLKPGNPDNTIEENSPSIQVVRNREPSSKTQKRAEPKKFDNSSENAPDPESENESSCYTPPEQKIPDSHPKWRHKIGYIRKKPGKEKCESQSPSLDSMLPENARSSNKPTIYISKCHAPECNQDHYHASHHPFSPTIHKYHSRPEPSETLPPCPCSLSTMSAPDSDEVSKQTVPSMPQTHRPVPSSPSGHCGSSSPQADTPRPQAPTSGSPCPTTMGSGDHHHVHTCVVNPRPHKQHRQQCQQSRCHYSASSCPGSPCHRPRCQPHCHPSPCHPPPCHPSPCVEYTCHTHTPPVGITVSIPDKRKQPQHQYYQQRPQQQLTKEQVQLGLQQPRQDQDEKPPQTNGLGQLNRRLDKR